MPISKYHAVEYRLKKYAKESAWSKYHRLKELAKHRKRCASMRQSVDNKCPHYSTHILVNRQRADIEEGTPQCLLLTSKLMKNMFAINKCTIFSQYGRFSNTI